MNIPKHFNHNQSMLERKMKKVRPPPISKNASSPPSGSKPIVFSQKEESELADYILQLQKILYRLTMHDVRLLAEELLRQNKKDYKLKANPCTRGNQWVVGFLKRHPEVILRIPSSSPNPIIGFSMAELKHFYEFLAQLYKLQKITPDRVYNTNDIEISTVAKDNKTFLSIGNKSNGYRSKADNEMVVVKVCVNANGQFLPNMMVFPFNNFKPDLLINVSQETWIVCTKCGFIRTESFFQWLRKLVAFSGAKKDRPVLLLFGGQTAYIKSIEIIKFAKENGIIMISFPPHTRHLLQPLDEEFVKTLNMCYVKEVDAYVQNNPERIVSFPQIVDLFHKALNAVATFMNIKDQFKRCGIFPLDSAVFKESDFISPITNNVQVYEQKTLASNKINENTLFTSNSYNFDLYDDPRPGCSFWPD